MKSVTVACFCHKSCCLSYVRSLASLETVPQCIGHASFDTLTQGSVATCLWCGGIL